MIPNKIIEKIKKHKNIFDIEKTYKAGDKVYFNGLGECIVKNSPGCSKCILHNQTKIKCNLNCSTNQVHFELLKKYEMPTFEPAKEQVIKYDIKENGWTDPSDVKTTTVVKKKVEVVCTYCFNPFK